MDKTQGRVTFFLKKCQVFSPFIFFFFFFFFISFLGWRYISLTLQSSIQEKVEQVQSQIEGRIKQTLNQLESVSSLYKASKSVERDEFHKFVEPYLSGNPWIQALEWVPRVSATERAVYEAAAKQEGFPDFQITERNNQQTLVTASARGEYYPVYYLEPFQDNKLSMGFDLGSDTERLRTLMVSASVGAPASTCPITLVQQPLQREGFLIFQPVYHNGESIDSIESRMNSLQGFAVGVFKVGKIVEDVMKTFPNHTLDIQLSEKEIGDHSGSPFIYREDPSSAKLPSQFVALFDGIHKKISYSVPIHVADRIWLLQGNFSRSYWEQKIVHMMKIVTIGIFIFVLPLMLLAINLSSHFSKAVLRDTTSGASVSYRKFFARISNYLAAIFRPSVWLMNRLKYPQKFILISGLFLLPLFLVMRLLILEMNDRIDFSQKEIYGDVYLRPLKALLVDVSEARSLTHLLTQGDITLRPKIISKSSEINNHFPPLREADNKYKHELKTMEKIENLYENWHYIFEKQRLSDKGDWDELYVEFIKEIRSLISYIGDTSNLILDPDLDTYYLMDSVLLKLPEQLDMLGKAQIFGYLAISDRVITAEERAELTRIQGVIRFNYEEAKRGLQVAFKNNPAGNLKPVLETPLKDFEMAVQNFSKMLDDEIIAKTNISVSSSEMDEHIGKVMLANSSLWDLCVRELDYLLEARIKRFEAKEHFAKVFSQIALLLVGYFLIAFYLSVKKTVVTLEQFSGRMMLGDFEGKLALDTRDELSRVVQSFNQVAMRLKNERDQARDESKRATEAELKSKASETRLKAIYDSSPLGIYLTDAKGDYLYTNISYQKISGLTSAEALGKGWINGVHADDRERVYDEWYRAATHGGVYESSHKFTHSDGNIVWAHVTAAQMKEGSNVTGYVGIVEDITKRKELEGQLLQSQKLESIGRLAAGAAHEVKNPLAILLQGIDYLDQCKQCNMNEVELQSIVNEMKNAVQRADKVIHGLLDFSAPQQLTLERADLNDIVVNSLQFVKHELDKAHVTAVEKLHRPLPKIMLDQNKMQQVFVNVFVNAIHAMEEGGALTVRTYLKGSNQTSALGRRQVFTEIEDTGKGISEAHLHKIFDPFFTTKPTGKGTGLGLSVVKSIVDLHGGTVYIANRSEGGVRVTFAFPEAASEVSRYFAA